MRFVCMSLVAAGVGLLCAAAGHAEDALRPPSAFAEIADRAARSRAVFAEAAKVLT